MQESALEVERQQRAAGEFERLAPTNEESIVVDQFTEEPVAQAEVEVEFGADR